MDRLHNPGIYGFYCNPPRRELGEADEHNTLGPRGGDSDRVARDLAKRTGRTHSQSPKSRHKRERHKEIGVWAQVVSEIGHNAAMKAEVSHWAESEVWVGQKLKSAHEMVWFFSHFFFSLFELQMSNLKYNPNVNINPTILNIVIYSPSHYLILVIHDLLQFRSSFSVLYFHL
jgi:hypothetical protein